MKFLDIFERGYGLTLLPINSSTCRMGEKSEFQADLGNVSKYLEKLGVLKAYDFLVIFENLLNVLDISTFITENYSKFIEARDSCQNLVLDALKDEASKSVFTLGAAIGQYQVLIGMESEKEQLEEIEILIRLSIIKLVQDRKFD